MRVLLTAALLPAILLMVYVFSRDRVEKEPLGLLLKLAAFGALSCIPAAIVESSLLVILQSAIAQGPLFTLVEAFLAVALTEEFFKLVFLKLATWKNDAFDYHFDGIVYAVFVSLGFAALENVLYLAGYGLSIAVSRGLFAVPGHMTFSVFMGLYYSEARQSDILGKPVKKFGQMLLALFVPMILHGIYDYLLMSGIIELSLVFIVFVSVLDVYAFTIIRRCSAADSPFERPW